MGEIVMRGNGVMKGYYNDEVGTWKATVGGWFHSGIWVSCTPTDTCNSATARRT